MRAYLLLVALGCLIHHGHAQGSLTQSISSRGVNYGFYEWEGSSTDLSSDPDPCPSNNNLAFWDSVEEYKDFIDEMVEGSVPAGDYVLGVRSEGGDSYMRTHNGRRLAPFVNYWETETDRTADGCTEMVIDSEGTENFYSSPWEASSSACTLNDGDVYICMDSSDPSCTEDCRGEGEDRSGEHCFWNPDPGTTWKHAEAISMCQKNGGELMNLLDAGDVTELEKLDYTPYNQQEVWSFFWTGLIQYPGQSHPRWANRSLVDAVSVWRSDPNLGSTLNSVAYAGIWGGRDRALDLFMIAPATDFDDSDFLDSRRQFRTSIEAFVACESTRDNFCLKNSADVLNADKSIVSYNKLRYTCKDGWEFPDHTTEREVTCSCDLHHYSTVDVDHCILKNPCKADVTLCQPHGYCIFTNEYLRPYYCLCKKGYEWDVHQQTCVDINECTEGDPCGSYYGHCINTEGSYWCQCTQGYGWNNDGHCTSYPVSPGYPGNPGQPVIHTMTIYFHVNMNYLPDMNIPSTEIHGHLRAALDQLTAHVYGGHTVLVDNFYIAGEQYGNMKIRVVFNVYVQADVTELSVYAWKFYNYIKTSANHFIVNSNIYPYYGSVYFESTKYTKQIIISSPCSIFDAIGQCHGSTCEADGYKPACVCQDGYQGEFCEDTIHAPEVHVTHILTSAEIGLIVAVVILFICVICITICLCCLLPGGCCHVADQVAPVYGTDTLYRRGHVARQVAPVYGTSGAAYVSRGPVLRRNFPKFV